MSADAWISARVSFDGVPGRLTTTLRPDCVLISASATPEPSTRWRMIATAWLSCSSCDVRTALNLGRQDHLGAAFKVQGELGSPARLAGHGAAGQDSGQDGENNAKPDQHPEG